jgi:hypothetical protein
MQDLGRSKKVPPTDLKIRSKKVPPTDLKMISKGATHRMISKGATHRLVQRLDGLGGLGIP